MKEFWKKEVHSPIILPPKYQPHHSGMMSTDPLHQRAHLQLAATPGYSFSVYLSLLWQTSFCIATYQKSRILSTARQPTKWLYLHYGKIMNTKAILLQIRRLHLFTPTKILLDKAAHPNSILLEKLVWLSLWLCSLNLGIQYAGLIHHLNLRFHLGKQERKNVRDNITASAISTGEVSSLNHEIFDDAMKFASSISISFLKRLCQLNTQVDITHTVR